MKSGFVLSLMWLGVASHVPTMLAQPAGAFTATGAMTTPRYVHTATLLADGRVLIAGGALMESAHAFRALASAELYDPGTGTFTATGDMTIARSEHTATLLPNGKVLIAGGRPAFKVDTISSSFPFAELYDPSLGTFTATGDMTLARSDHTATLLPDGRILIVGGSSDRPASAELYDPDSGTFTATGDMTAEWADTATLLPNGKVLISRGNPEGPPPYLSSADLYDPSTGTFASAHYLTTNHSGPTANLLINGRVLIAGGDVGDGDGGSYSAELYDPSTGTFGFTGSMTERRELHTATVLADGTVLFTGGHALISASAELYDPVTGRFGTTGGLPEARDMHTATLLAAGRVLISGGQTAPSLDAAIHGNYSIVSSALLYTPAVSQSAPALLSLSGDGRGQGAIQHADTYQVVSSTNPADAGEALVIYCTGLAEESLIPPQVAIGGRMAEILWFGKTPGFAALNQVNVRMPSVAPGPAAAVRLTYLNRPSNEVTISVK